ncbi:hypothetical protein, partial [uncultured Chryseobacterium sp.]|uniref:hypothetical protein n=1 Tax=uncultured Chryseobacterium sp. TaxID=259322 RepID=UPI0025D65FDC
MNIQLQLHHSLAKQNSPFTVNGQFAALVNSQWSIVNVQLQIHHSLAKQNSPFTISPINFLFSGK